MGSWRVSSSCFLQDIRPVTEPRILLRTYYIWKKSILCIFLIDSGSTCRNNNFCAQCDTYDKTGRIQILTGTWKNGCSWNYEHVSYDVVGTLSAQCNDRYKCCVNVDDTLQNCNSDYYSAVYYSTSYTSSFTCWMSTCYVTRYRTASYTARLRKICGILYYAYSCTSTFSLK